MIVNPITLPANASLAEAERLMSHYHISGVPITNEEGQLVGILTNRDIRFVTPGDQQVSEFMTSRNLITAKVGTTLEEAKQILHQHRIEKLPLVDDNGRLKGLITVKDIVKKLDFPLQVSDPAGRLLCAAAIGVGEKALASWPNWSMPASTWPSSTPPTAIPLPSSARCRQPASASLTCPSSPATSPAPRPPGP